MAIEANATIIDTFTIGGSDGAITLHPSPMSTYNIGWTGPNSYMNMGYSISGLSAGNYTASISDPVPPYDSLVEVFTVGETGPAGAWSLEGFPTNITTWGGNDGAITIDEVGIPNATYQWFAVNRNLISTGDTITGLDAGIYYLYGTNPDDGTIVTRRFVLTEPLQPLSITGFSVTPASTSIAYDGGIGAVNKLGGTSPFTYGWTGPNGYEHTGDAMMSGAIYSVCAGTYFVLVTDSLGATAAGSTAVGVRPFAVDIIYPSPSSGLTATDGAIGYVHTYGGTEPLTYSWTGPNGFSAISDLGWTGTTGQGGNYGGGLTGLVQGVYYVTVTDSTEAQVGASGIVLYDSPLTIKSITTTDASGATASDGVVNYVYMGGGVQPYTYYGFTGPNGWSGTGDSMMNGYKSGLIPGGYYATVRDSSATEAYYSFEIGYTGATGGTGPVATETRLDGTEIVDGSITGTDVADGTLTDADFAQPKVSRAGDTMSGPLIVQGNIDATSFTINGATFSGGATGQTGPTGIPGGPGATGVTGVGVDGQTGMTGATGIGANIEYYDCYGIPGPSGTTGVTFADGIGIIFDIGIVPDSGSLHLFYNGLMMAPGTEADYVVAGSVITFNYPPHNGANLWGNFRKTIA